MDPNAPERDCGQSDCACTVAEQRAAENAAYLEARSQIDQLKTRIAELNAMLAARPEPEKVAMAALDAAIGCMDEGPDCNRVAGMIDDPECIAAIIAAAKETP